MSRNNLLAIALVGLLVLAASPATAQIPQADLVIEQIDSGANRIMGVHSLVRVTIRNIGAGPYNGGGEMFVGFNGWEAEDCINATAPIKRQGDGCYTAVPALAPQSSVTLTVNWNATRAQADHPTPTLYVGIATSLNQPNWQAGNCGTAVPDAPTTCENNRKTQAGIVIKKPGVRAQPLRTASPSADGNVQTGWKWQEVVTADAKCLRSTEGSVDVACFTDPGTEVAGLFRVTNLGNAADTFIPTFIDDASPSLASLGIEVVPPPAFTLQPGEPREVKVLMRIPKEAAKGIAVNGNTSLSKVRFTSSLNPEITTASDQPGCTGSTLCVDPTLPTVYVAPRYGFNVTTNATWRPGLPGQPVQFNLTINNTGNVFDDFDVRIDKNTSTTNDSWSPSITLPNRPNAVGERLDTTINLAVPLRTLNQTYHFDVIVSSRSDKEGKAKCIADDAIATFSEPTLGIRHGVGVCRTRLYVHVGQTYGLSSSGDVPASVVPDTPVTFRLQLTNTGNGFDNATLELQSNVFGWNAELSTNVVQLRPDNTTPFTLSVRPPPNTAAGVDGYFYINATSVARPEVPGDQRAKAPMIVSRVTVLNGPNMVLAPIVNSSFVDPGKTIDYAVSVRNTGNAADNFSLSAATRSPDWSAAVTPPHINLAPNQEGVVTVTVRAPELGGVGETTRATLTAASTVEPSRTRTTDLDARISGPDFRVVSLLVNASNPYSGDPLEISLTLENAGNRVPPKGVGVTVFFTQAGNNVPIYNKTINATDLPGQRRITETIVWDTARIEGTGTLTARIDPNDEIKEINEDAGNEATRPLTLRTLEIDVKAPAPLSGRPGQRVVYGEAPHVFTVEYRGNQPNEPVTIELLSQHGWLKVEGSQLSVGLQRGTPLPVVAELDIPALPGTNKDALTLRVTPTFRPADAKSVTVVTTVIDEEKPRVTGLTVEPRSTTLGRPVNISATFVDATGISSATAFITSPSNETSALVLAPVGAGRWAATQTYLAAGTYRVAVEAIDNATPPLRNNSRDTVATFTVTPGSAPAIKLASGQGTTIRTGGTLRLDISDPLGIAKASYAIKGINYDLKAPDYAVDTSSFPAGPVEINVTAENIYGVRSSAKFTFTVDNTPPTIRKVALSPEQPLANQEVVVRVETDPGVQGVDVLVKRNGQVVDTISATRKSQGVFETKLNPGEGEYRIDVTARDEAGNAKVEASAVQFSARKDDVPSPGVLLVVVALALVALAARRRL